MKKCISRDKLGEGWNLFLQQKPEISEYFMGLGGGVIDEKIVPGS
jgi:hypothetical protein